MVKLGDRVVDTLTGFSGVVTARTEYIYGCVQLLVVPRELKDGVPSEGQWIDEQRFGPQTATAGGPQNTPPKRSVPN